MDLTLVVNMLVNTLAIIAVGLVVMIVAVRVLFDIRLTQSTYVTALVLLFVAMCVGYVDYKFRHDDYNYSTEKLVEDLNSGELTIIPNNVVRKVNDNYIVENEDGKYTILNKYEYIDSNGNVYVKRTPNE